MQNYCTRILLVQTPARRHPPLLSVLPLIYFLLRQNYYEAQPNSKKMKAVIIEKNIERSSHVARRQEATLLHFFRMTWGFFRGVLEEEVSGGDLLPLPPSPLSYPSPPL
uniref:Uncharacterized protein n=1 Tax=Nelumbo nucifera TaxID=4432 RepID=A0A822YIJ6_NELNU|nr:TPA_asm: hypothetical protein HUJ06_010794 [Nelumbo nucifera]